MAPERSPLMAKHAAIGEYVPAGPSDKRSPCPMINSLANHGYLPRNGQNILAHEIKAAMAETGVSEALGAIFVNAVYNVHQSKSEKSRAGLLSRLYTTVRDPWTLLSSFGMRRSDQKDSAGRPVLDLDQLALPGAVEHDISLTRRDHAQKEGNLARQHDLIEGLLATSADRRKITRTDLAWFRRQRIETQREVNPDVTYGPLQHELACGEIALILGVFGDGRSAPYKFVEPFLREERLPIAEGWKKRQWWTLGVVEVKIIAMKVKSLVGTQIK
ncbi:uncharacterized protein M421DRAFT_424640 [Didymella exigua CBS 183.55]|uniref:Heme haloperoxidase family profile domain-containing protein n=1 Tax=Didymella exigua CBS 183.55 TaxID=1150837 RepID=A0A6A5R946_9PLEO|nr:uncharacterized protein M421DRAFT_424640 [Didymella exigua CBS 183.55]KAF1924751.1 hypothetical protein M421DRAFT_424640 [Didymella exigua CBS 183.55]